MAFRASLPCTCRDGQKPNAFVCRYSGKIDPVALIFFLSLGMGMIYQKLLRLNRVPGALVLAVFLIEINISVPANYFFSSIGILWPKFSDPGSISLPEYITV